MPSVLGGLVEAILPPLTRGVGVALPALHALTVQGTLLQGSTLRAASLGGIVTEAPILSANEIIRQVRAMGLPLRRQSALQAIAAMRQQVSAHEYVVSLTGGRMPIASRLPFTATRQRLSYQYTVKVVGTDMETGLQSVGFVRINNTRLMTKNQAVAEAMATIDFGTSAGLTDVNTGDVIMITKQNPNIVNA